MAFRDWNKKTGGRDMKMFNADYFNDWDYKKHARFCTALYLALYAFDMTFSYFIIKKIVKKG